MTSICLLATAYTCICAAKGVSKLLWCYISCSQSHTNTHTYFDLNNNAGKITIHLESENPDGFCPVMQRVVDCLFCCLLYAGVCQCVCVQVFVCSGCRVFIYTLYNFIYMNGKYNKSTTKRATTSQTRCNLGRIWVDGDA